jgi:hypothetical protein
MLVVRIGFVLIGSEAMIASTRGNRRIILRGGVLLCLQRMSSWELITGRS